MNVDLNYSVLNPNAACPISSSVRIWFRERTRAQPMPQCGEFRQLREAYRVRHNKILNSMPKKDIYHDVVRNALVKDGWTITHDPLILSWGFRSIYVDLGAEQPLAAEKEGRKIAVEVKSFVSPSAIHDLEQALGQYSLYCSVLARKEPERRLYLAITEDTYEGIFSEPMGQIVLADRIVSLIVFNLSQEVIVRWIE